MSTLFRHLQRSTEINPRFLPTSLENKVLELMSPLLIRAGLLEEKGARWCSPLKTSRILLRNQAIASIKIQEKNRPKSQHLVLKIWCQIWRKCLKFLQKTNRKWKGYHCTLIPLHQYNINQTFMNQSLITDLVFNRGMILIAYSYLSLYEIH